MSRPSSTEQHDDLSAEPESAPVASLLDQEPERRGRVVAKRGKGCLAVLVALAVVVGGGYFVWSKLSGAVQDLMATPDYTTTHGVADIKVTVSPGSSLTTIGQQLVSSDVIKSDKAFSQAIHDFDGQPTVQAGSYKMRTQLPAAVALDRLTKPQKYRIRNQIQVLEGLRLSDQVAALAKATKIPAKQYQAALAKPKELGLPAWANGKPEGFLFPDSYELTDKADAAAVLEQMTGRFDQVSTKIDLTSRADALGVTPYQVVIVASLIEAEVNRPQDRAKAARVIYNRLHRGMPLQLDSTVHYAIGQKGKITTTDKDRANTSPYNTYAHKGLPPGPIGAPGEAALKAAANPADGDWLYWVAVNPDSGETVFTNTQAEHDAAVHRFQQWCQSHKGRC